MPASVDGSCTTSTAVLLLFISTKDATSDTARVSIQQTKKTCSSSPGGGKGFVLYPLQNAQGSAYCPAGTHTVTLAAWCCLDGSNLDEVHANGVSLCCPGSKHSYIAHNIPYQRTDEIRH